MKFGFVANTNVFIGAQFNLEARIRHTAESHNYPQGIAVSIMNHNALGYHLALYNLDLRRVNHAL